MKPEVHKFRGVLLGGFHRRDVTEYIEKTAREQQGKLAELTGQLEQAKQERDALAAQLDGLRSRSGDLAEQETKMRASLEESTQSMTQMRGELKTARDQLVQAQKQLAQLQDQVARLEPLAQQYESLKDHVASVELDAYRKAQIAVSEAEAEAERIRQDTAQWLTELSSSYEALREEVFACAERTEEVRRAFAAKEEAYQDLLRRGGLHAPEEEPHE